MPWGQSRGNSEKDAKMTYHLGCQPATDGTCSYARTLSAARWACAQQPCLWRGGRVGVPAADGGNRAVISKLQPSRDFQRLHCRCLHSTSLHGPAASPQVLAPWARSLPPSPGSVRAQCLYRSGSCEHIFTSASTCARVGPALGKTCLHLKHWGR